MKDVAAIDRELRALKPFNRKCRLEINGGINRPPMERTAGVAALYEKASEIAKRAGWKLEEAAGCGGPGGKLSAGVGGSTLDWPRGGGGRGAPTPEASRFFRLPRREG